jgi:DNA-binding transcriptional MerR regulator
MRIGEVARCAGVTPRALRYYEERGLISAARDHNGYRIYDDDTVHLARHIARLLNAGLSSQDVLRFRDCLRQETPPPPEDCPSLIEAYRSRLDALDRRIVALTDLRQRLADEIHRLRVHRDTLTDVS